MKKLAISTTGLFVAALAVPAIASANTITVKSGDTLYSIATKHNLSVNELKSLNKLTSNTIYVGQSLVVSKASNSNKTEKIEYRTVTGASWLNVRSGAGNNYGIVTTIKGGTEVEILSEKNGWYYISANGKKGYSYSSYFSGPRYVTVSVPSTPTPTPTPTSNVYYTVVSGDTLWSIATKHGVSVDTIKSLNKLSSNTIFKGQKLLIKQTSSNTVTNPTPSTPAPTPTNPSTTYKVVKGDTLFGIANKHNMDVNTLKSINGLSSNIIYIGQTLKVQVQQSQKIFERPAEGVVTSEFGPRIHPIYGNQGTHWGTDFAKTGNVEVKAAAAGTVSRSYVSSSYGEVVFIKHVIGGQAYETVYAHMRTGSRAVQVGDKVSAGQFIGWMGSTGDSTGQHTHFEVHKGEWNTSKSNAVDPLLYLK